MNERVLGTFTSSSIEHFLLSFQYLRHRFHTFHPNSLLLCVCVPCSRLCIHFIFISLTNLLLRAQHPREYCFDDFVNAITAWTGCCCWASKRKQIMVMTRRLQVTGGCLMQRWLLKSREFRSQKLPNMIKTCRWMQNANAFSVEWQWRWRLVMVDVVWFCHRHRNKCLV